jgi:hypothetical protein
MAMNKSFKQWLPAIILVSVLVLFLDWLVNHHPIQTKFSKGKYYPV